MAGGLYWGWWVQRCLILIGSLGWQLQNGWQYDQSQATKFHVPSHLVDRHLSAKLLCLYACFHLFTFCPNLTQQENVSHHSPYAMVVGLLFMTQPNQQATINIHSTFFIALKKSASHVLGRQQLQISLRERVTWMWHFAGLYFQTTWTTKTLSKFSYQGRGCAEKNDWGENPQWRRRKVGSN